MIDGIIESAFSLGQVAIEKIWPDPTKRAEEMRKLESLRQDGDIARLNAHVQLMLGQIETNQIDAKSDSKFQSWWRPAIGWTGAISLFLMYVPKAIAMTVMWTWQNIIIFQNTAAEDIGALQMVPFPDLGASDVIGLLISMLGVAGMRSFDKKNNINTK